ncbi:hypothetical protein A8709_14340 [Paenibacillus pectinilyticus]|uniref:CBM-cenC domain-containing protein n=1 Tax=Paenibacillus pectinilyticus TaxID=512399 RepID=A0A1C1A3Y8_9BACL|nr:carbohydrate binding domain-containing protein [Paenibacillus pectinilyticus]OCT15274.1 hypothetical protein A8709_14340 [Paenibacillus pectinilyticus]
MKARSLIGVMMFTLLFSLVLGLNGWTPKALADGYGKYMEKDPSHELVYPRVVRLSNGTLLATYANNNRYATIKKSTDGGLTWTSFSTVDLGSDINTGGSLESCCETLFAFPQQLGSYAADTLLYANTIFNANDASKGETRIYRSINGGSTWAYVTTVFTGGNTWEPEFIVDAAGELALYVSDERSQSQGYSQFLGHIISTDGGNTWGSMHLDIGIANNDYRPGMIRIAKLNNGTYMAAYEVCGTPGCNMYTRISSDGVNWGTATSMGTKPTDSQGRYFNSTADIVNANGKVYILAKKLFTSAGVEDSDSGKVMFVNSASDGTGTWSAVPLPFSFNTSYFGGYSPSLLPSVDGQSMLLVSPSYNPTLGKAEMDYDTELAGNMLANPNYESDTSNWTTWGTTISSVTSPVQNGSKALYASNRTLGTDSWAGQNVKALLQKYGQGNYNISAWVRSVSGTKNASIVLSVNSGGTWKEFKIPGQMNSSGWTKISGVVNVTWSSLDDAIFLVRNTSDSADYYVDNTYMSKTSNILQNASFEGGTSNWMVWNTTMTTQSSPSPIDGSKVLLASNRTSDDAFIGQNIKNVLQTTGKGTYNISAWVRAASGSKTANVTVSLQYDGTWHETVMQGTITDSGWTLLTGTVDANWSTLTDAVILIRNATDRSDYYVDDCIMSRL